MSSLARTVLLIAPLFVSSSAAAITAKDVMEKMSKEERFGYLTGLADMLSYQYVLAGDRPRAECISKEFYSKKEETWKRVYNALEAFPDKAPEGLIVVLMKKSCGG
jgi:hypothetical protein